MHQYLIASWDAGENDEGQGTEDDWVGALGKEVVSLTLEQVLSEGLPEEMISEPRPGGWEGPTCFLPPPFGLGMSPFPKTFSAFYLFCFSHNGPENQMGRLEVPKVQLRKPRLEVRGACKV